MNELNIFIDYLLPLFVLQREIEASTEIKLDAVPGSAYSVPRLT
jgi:hypothetical protein